MLFKESVEKLGQWMRQNDRTDPELAYWIKKWATETEVKVAYRALARIYHPNKHDPTRTEMTQAEASEYFKIINNPQSYLCEVL